MTVNQNSSQYYLVMNNDFSIQHFLLLHVNMNRILSAEDACLPSKFKNPKL